MVMRRTLSRKVTDICVFCALRYGSESRALAPRVGHQVRSYKSSIAAQRPATAAARAEDDDEDDYSPRYFHQTRDRSLKNPPPPPPPEIGRGYGAFGDAQPQTQCDDPRKTGSNHNTNRQASYRDNNNTSGKQGFRISYHAVDSRNSDGDQQRSRNEDTATWNAFGKGRSEGSTRTDTRTRDDRYNQSQRPQTPRFARSRSVYRNDDQSLPSPSAEQNPLLPDFKTMAPVQRPSIEAAKATPENNAEPATRAWRPFGKTDDQIQAKEEISKEVVPSSSTMPVPLIQESVNEEEASRKRRLAKERSSRRDRIFESGIDAEEPEKAPVVKRKNVKQTATSVRDFESQLEEDMLYDEEMNRRKKKSKKKAMHKPVEAVRPTVHLPEFISVEKLAQALKVRLNDFIAKLEDEGYEGARYDHILDYPTSTMLADLYGFDPVATETRASQDLVARPPAEDPAVLPPRPPIVTIMGHVDHGKTTILDWLRKSSVVASEHGGITQHIGAFSFSMPGSERQITFLDTPGHSAFLEMRRRGANVTDIVVLVVAADDSVKPQTIEAIKHALEAKVQIIVAINKVDKADANVERVKQDLARHDITVEDLGGDYQSISVSGKTGQGMDDLEEAILTLADVNDYRAENDGPAEGWIIESKVTTGGRVATVLVRRGTLRPGDYIVAGPTWARVRTLKDDAGRLVSEAPPGTPVQVDGWRGADPMAGAEVLQAENEDQAKEVVDIRLEQLEDLKSNTVMETINAARSEEADARAKVLAWEAEQDWSKKSFRLRPKENEGWVEKEDNLGFKRVHFVVKADVAGSVEALNAAVSAIGNNEIAANIVHSGTGQLTESDIKVLASTGEVGYVISFNQPIDGAIRHLAAAAGVRILDHNIIYKVTDDVKEKLSDELPPNITQRVLGEAEIGQIFEVSTKKGKLRIAGCKVTNGTISRSEKVRVSRNGEVVYTGTLNSLKNVKKDVTEIRKGTECGMGFEAWEEFQEGDQIQSFEEKSEKRKLY